jgi:protein-S-isoprenylcysteine O-methyltransferase Ste14
MNAQIRARLFECTSFIERYLLSTVYFWFAYEQGEQLQQLWFHWSSGTLLSNPVLARVANTTIILLLQLLIGACLLNSHKPVTPPKRIREIVVPLCSCAYFVLYGLADRLPAPWRTSIFSDPVPTPSVLLGLFFGVLGPALSLWGVISLGKSFGIFVSARKPVITGAYRYVRHPIYMGYFFIWVGLCLVNWSPAILALVAGHILLFKIRSRMEEACLASSSPEYANYLKHTGAFVPKRQRQRPNTL